jgi:hypothetical protein
MPRETRGELMRLVKLKDKIKSAISLFNSGSDNKEYLRGQVELALFLLDDEQNEELKAELERVANV